MANFAPSRVARLAVAALLLAASPLAAQKSVKKAEQSPWQMAEEARSQLLAIPADQRTAEDYRTVMDAYRLIYHGNPGDTHAPESVYQVGALLAEQGAVLHDTRSSQNAIGQFEFLRKTTPPRRCASRRCSKKRTSPPTTCAM